MIATTDTESFNNEVITNELTSPDNLTAQCRHLSVQLSQVRTSRAGITVFPGNTKTPAPCLYVNNYYNFAIVLRTRT
jgi:hypothetical protein